ncbi:hypothetical protein D3C75_1390540 [compost metagenome]
MAPKEERKTVPLPLISTMKKPSPENNPRVRFCILVFTWMPWVPARKPSFCTNSLYDPSSSMD